MIDVKIAVKLLEQCRGMQAAPRNREDLRMRAEALANKSRSEAHARAVVSALLERLTFFPNVADLTQACANTEDPSGAEARSRTADCPHCHGEGWRTVEGPHGLSAAYPCNHSSAGSPSMGIKLSPSLNSRYMAESRESNLRSLDWRDSANFPPTKFDRNRRPKPPEPNPMRRVTAEDFEALAPKEEVAK